MNESTKEIKLDAVEEAVAALLKEPESIKLKEEMELAWESIPTFGLAPMHPRKPWLKRLRRLGNMRLLFSPV